MPERALRIGVIILAIFASLVHFYLTISSFLRSGAVDALVALWLLNAVGYLCLLSAYLGLVALFRGEDGIGYSMMAYAIVTVVAWWNIDNRTGILGWITAADELLLVITLFFHMRVRPKPEPDPDSF